MEVLADRYELAEPLGSGGMAQVSAAYDRVLDRRVAVKLIHGSKLGDPVGRERFWREARAAARLSHPNTVAVHDFGDEDGRPFIVMELVEGRSLADRLREEGRLPVEDVVALGAAVLAGLSAAHRRGLVHRDVKPSNILLPDEGGVKLADFGIATALAETVTRLTGTGELVGTPRYMAPECAAGQRATAASDLYALAVVIYECLAGRAPFEAETPVAMAVAHQREPVPSLASTAPHVPAPVATVVEQALAKDPTARFGDADAMRRALVNPTSLPESPAATPQPQAPGGRPDAAPLSRDSGAERKRRRWIRLAVSGWLAALVALVGYLVVNDVGDAPSEEPAADEEPDVREIDVLDLQVGDCTRELPDTGEISTVEAVPCSEEHSHEVFAAASMPGDAYPGGDAVAEFARGNCLAEFEEFVGLPRTLSGLEFGYFTPPEASWADGRREILCTIHDPEGTVTGSLEGADR